MILVHTLKTKGSEPHQIQIDRAVSLDPESFAVYTKQFGEEIEHVALGWRLPVAEEQEGKYAGHQFELQVGPDEIDLAIRALQWAKEKFAKQEVPS